MTIINPIETTYKGYRFRSRLEARWAVFFDAAGIEWEYEAEGYDVGGRWYLPDFWLPKLKTFVEIKSTEKEFEAVKPVMQELMKTTGHQCMVIIGSPNIEPPKTIIYYKGFWTRPPPSWAQCPFCARLVIGCDICNCATDVRFIQRPPNANGALFHHALGEGQRARFEHGENGAPRRYHANAPTKISHVYVAGPVLSKGDDIKPLSWRDDIFKNDCRSGRFAYAGPTIRDNHGIGYHDLANVCLVEVSSANAFFVWIDREDTVGTLVEISAASAMRKPIFVAFENESLARRFYFASQLADVAIIAPSAVAAWGLFTRWQDRGGER